MEPQWDPQRELGPEAADAVRRFHEGHDGAQRYASRIAAGVALLALAAWGQDVLRWVW